MFEAICEKYNDLAEVDKLVAVNQKVDAVKLVMHDNVEKLLANTVKLDAIEKATEELQEQAGVFRKSAVQLKNKMWWKNVRVS
jgi:vesicle-associated membrane protein 4